MAQELTRMVKKEKVVSTSIFLFAKCSFLPSLFATHLIRFSATNEGELILPDPEKIIVAQTDTATVKPGADFFFPISELAFQAVVEKAGYQFRKNQTMKRLLKEVNLVPLVKLDPQIKDYLGLV